MARWWRERYTEEKARSAGVHRWFERLPLRLRKEPKRQRVVKALKQALEEFAADEPNSLS